MSSLIGAGLLWNGMPHPLARTGFPAPYPVGTAIGEYLRVESVLRLGQGRMYYLVNNIGPKWARRKCWSCGNRFIPDKARACTYCFVPLRDLRMLMTVRWDRRGYDGYARFVAKRLEHFGLISPAAVYYRDGYLLGIYHYNGEHLLLDQVAPMAMSRVLITGQFLCRMLDFLHDNGVALRRLGAENLLVMPDRSVRLFDLDVQEISSRKKLEAHPQDPIRRDTRRLGELLLRLTPPENDAYCLLFERAAAGRISDPQALRRAMDLLAAQGDAQEHPAKAGAFCDLGLVRSRNEDFWGWRRLSEQATLYVVADGLGGHAYGDRAARVAVRSVCEVLGALPEDASVEAFRTAIEKSFRVANKAVHEAGQRLDQAIGTTLAVVVKVGKTLLVGNTGDSRVWLFRGGELTQVSRDHTVAQDLIEAGRLDPEKASEHPQGNVLTATIGGPDEDLEVALNQAEAKAGDRVLLATDGIWNELDERRIAALLEVHTERKDAIRALVRESYAAGGRDNVALILLDVD